MVLVLNIYQVSQDLYISIFCFHALLCVISAITIWLLYAMLVAKTIFICEGIVFVIYKNMWCKYMQNLDSTNTLGYFDWMLVIMRSRTGSQLLWVTYRQIESRIHSYHSALISKSVKGETNTFWLLLLLNRYLSNHFEHSLLDWVELLRDQVISNYKHLMALCCLSFLKLSLWDEKRIETRI